MVKVSVDITLSKILAYLILLIGAAYSFMFQDATVLMSSFGAASAVIVAKTYTASQERKKRIEFQEPSTDDDGPDI